MGGETLADARRRFFADSGFAPDGGYDDAWADAQFGPVRYSVPNPPMRGEALRVHDLHHPLTGYGADWRGEAMISAWELGSGGGGRYAYAWFIALFGLFTGLLALPLATWRAFVAGRSARNLYADREPDRWLHQPIDEVRQALAIGTLEPATARDRVAFAMWSALAIALAAVFVAGIPLLLGAAWLRRLTAPSRCSPCCMLRSFGLGS